MTAKLILYVLIIPVVMWSLLGLNIEKYFKQNKTTQIRIFLFALTLAISYLIASLFFEFL